MPAFDRVAKQHEAAPHRQRARRSYPPQCHARIRAAVTAALHRDLIELDVRPATTAELLDGLTGFRPHVVGFSGHSNEDLVVFEDDRDETTTASSSPAFARATSATDDPPLLVSLNACNRRPDARSPPELPTDR